MNGAMTSGYNKLQMYMYQAIWFRKISFVWDVNNKLNDTVIVKFLCLKCEPFTKFM